MTTVETKNWRCVIEAVNTSLLEVGLHRTLLAITTAMEENQLHGVVEQIDCIKYPDRNGEYLTKDTKI